MIRNHKGFTLIEILIALMILAVVGSMTVIGLQSAIRSQLHLSEKAQRLATIQSAIIVIQRDIEQIINRPIFDVDGSLLTAIIVHYPGNKLNLEFTHAGYINPFNMINRTTLQRVSYAWDGDNLSRSTWQVLDRVQGSTFDTQVLLSHVKSFKVRFLDKNNQFYIPDNSPQPNLPVAIEFNVEIDGIGTITRLIPLPG